MLVSVIIPSYNHARFIKAAVESVLHQSHRALELIVVDDGSSDNSLDYLRTIKDQRFKLVEQKNAGAHEAINRGLAIAQGDFLAILNSDDVYRYNRLELCLREMCHSDADLVASWIDVIDAKGKSLGVKQGWENMLPWEIKPSKTSFSADKVFWRHLLMSNFVSTTSNVVFKRSIFEKIGGMRNLRFTHDWDFLLRVARHYRCHLIKKPLVQYRVHGDNTIRSNKQWMAFEICWVWAIAFRAYRSQLWSRDVAQSAQAKEIAHVFGSINLRNNDKLFWLINAYIDAQLEQGVESPELALLEPGVLRESFIALTC